jgi:hypothetical protein
VLYIITNQPYLLTNHIFSGYVTGALMVIKTGHAFQHQSSADCCWFCGVVVPAVPKLARGQNSPGEAPATDRSNNQTENTVHVHTLTFFIEYMTPSSRGPPLSSTCSSTQLTAVCMLHQHRTLYDAMLAFVTATVMLPSKSSWYSMPKMYDAKLSSKQRRRHFELSAACC